jgi:BON domain
MKFIMDRTHFLRAGALVLALVLGLAAGCKNQPAARTDQQISSDIQAKINGEGALAQQSIQVSVASGVATLTGTVTDEASRALAGNDSGTVAGVKTVVNNLTVQAAQSAPPPAAQPVPQTAQSEPPPAQRPERDKRHRDRQKDEAPAAPAPPEQVAEVAPPPPPPAQETPAPPPPLPPAPPKPVTKLITLDAGTVVAVRITETLDSKTAQPNDVFHGSIAGDLSSQGVVVIPRGAPVIGRIVDAKEAAHFKGNSMLSLELTEVTARGQNVTLVTDTYSKEGEGRGKNTAEKVGGGAALGSIIGALAGGGKGAVIGGLAGGAAGTGVNAATRGQQTVIPTETLINFRLQSPITVKVTIPPSGADEDNVVKDPQLQPR